MDSSTENVPRPTERTGGDRGREPGNPDQDSQNPQKRRRRFHCQFCVREFLQKEHLQRHERLHTKEKPFRCTVCSRPYTRSDLLARHIRLCHKNTFVDHDGLGTSSNPAEEPSQRAGNAPTPPNSMPSHILRNSDISAPNHPSHIDYVAPCSGSSASNNLEALLDSSCAATMESSIDTSHMLEAQPNPNFDDFALFIDSMSTPYANDLSTTFADQLLLPLSPAPIFGAPNPQDSRAQWGIRKAGLLDGASARTSVPQLFDEFSSTFPSFEMSSAPKFQKESWKITQQDWDHFLAETQLFTHIIPPEFSLPSRHTITRYIATYFSGFHRHLPFLHVPTFSPTQYPVELILAIAAIGAQYSFDNDSAVMFFRTSYAMILERLRLRRAELCKISFPAADKSLLGSPTLNMQWLERSSSVRRFSPGPAADRNSIDQWDPLPAAQTLLLLMAISTWGNSKAIFNEAVGLQNTLANLVREERVLEAHAPAKIPEDMTWYEWIHVEGHKRTVVIIFCFFIFHTILYDTPPRILNSELNLHLPSSELVWAARSEKDWQEMRKSSEPEQPFRSCFSFLFSKQSDESTETSKGHSSLGGYTLILALIQHIYSLREMSKCKPGSDQSISSIDVAEVEHALKNWQNGWYSNPESSLGPGSPQGPISFNSTALLRMAYIRLNVDVGPWRALNTHDPYEIANSIYQSPHLELNHKLTRTVLYCAHALSIPIKIGVNIVARNQVFIWSHQHALCALECAFVLSKWLIAVERRLPEIPLDEDEGRLLTYITDMVAEADPGFCVADNGEMLANIPDLCGRVIKIWARLLSGEAIWDVARMIAKSLAAYGQILEKRSAT